MYKLCLKGGDCDSIRMVKNKRDLKSPGRRSSLLRTGVRARTSSARSTANIKVVVRVRPPNEREQESNSRTVIKTINEQLLIFDPEADAQPFFYHGVEQKRRDLLKKTHKNMKFYFDRVFGFEATNDDIFKTTTHNLIDCLMDGCNCSVFVYGATGAGKTHTMLGHSENPGITVLTMKALFERKLELSTERDFELGVTYLEVYNENVQDLLNPGHTLQLREDGRYGVIVAGIQVIRIDESAQLFELLEKGNKNRTQHPTDANAESSRSHAVFQVYMQMKFKTTGQTRVAKLSMIDLAGSERGAATGCAGMRFTEGANINRSLLALGNCINSLAGGLKHVPYRDSKLTRLLKDSLGGNCHTIMIANVAPSSHTYEDTYNTLKYATRAKKIKCMVKKNVVNNNLGIENYVKIIEELTAENERLKDQIKQSEEQTREVEHINTFEELSAEIERLKSKLKQSPEQAEDEKLEISQNQTFEISVCGCDIPSESKTKLLNLFSERRKVEEKLHQLKISEDLLSVTKMMKKTADSRLSNVCIETPEKLKSHKRLGNAVNRITRHVNILQEDASALHDTQEQLQEQVEELLKKESNLKGIVDLESAKLSGLESKHEAEQERKLNEKLNEELHSQSELINKMSSILRTCYLEVKGHGFVTERLETDYQELVKELQRVYSLSVTFDKNIPFTPLTNNHNEEESRKRKLEGSTCSLDATFVSTPARPRPALTTCADHLLAKVYKPPAKKMPKVSPRKERKENRQLARKPTAAMGTSERFPSAMQSRIKSSKTKI